jgi:hypothetical protein
MFKEQLSRRLTIRNCCYRVVIKKLYCVLCRVQLEFCREVGSGVYYKTDVGAYNTVA